MAKAIVTPPVSRTAAAPASHRPRISSVLAVIAFGFLAIVGAIGVDWTDGPAMVFGELMGILAPIALIGLAALIIYRIYKRASAN